MATKDFTQWSTLDAVYLDPVPAWVPDDERDRVKAYTKYDQIYWNDPRQYELRVLEGEQPIYIPNARTIVDTTSHYLLKGLTVGVGNPTKNTLLAGALNAFLTREAFYARFHTAKHAGIARGDFIFHLTANPRKAPGTRISLNSVDPGGVFPIYDPDDPSHVIGYHLVDLYQMYDEKLERTIDRVKKLTYRVVEVNGQRRISREEGIYELQPKWYSKEIKLVKQTLPLGLLDPAITSLPVYWFKNLDWDNQIFGSSELRGLEGILQGISQGTTDTQAALSLEGLGVYATDGGRPIDDQGNEVDWEVAPGKVMEIPAGSKFFRVQGVGSITPMKDQLTRLEGKLREATALTDIALGISSTSVASSGIALQIQFSPTLAKIEERDTAGLLKIQQLFFDWKIWHQTFERESLEGEIIAEIGDKLPVDRVAMLNELNNMLDRRVISTAYYRDRMTRLGYIFPDDIEDQIDTDLDRVAAATPGVLTQPAQDEENQSNNRNRPNESSGTEADQPQDGSSDSSASDPA